MNKAQGTLHYSPNLLGEGTKWWLVLWCDKSIVKYYRHLYSLHHFHCKKLIRPAWDSHITIIRDEEPPDRFKDRWRALEGHTVRFFYKHEPCTNGDYWWLPVVSDDLLDIRESLGLDRNPYYSLHLSFGHQS